MSKEVYRSANGKPVDMGALRLCGYLIWSISCERQVMTSSNTSYKTQISDGVKDAESGQ